MYYSDQSTVSSETKDVYNLQNLQPIAYKKADIEKIHHLFMYVIMNALK